MKPDGGKALRIGFKAHLTRGTEAARHYYTRLAGVIRECVADGTIVPCAAGDAVTLEFNISALIHAHLVLVRGSTLKIKAALCPWLRFEIMQLETHPAEHHES